MKLLQILKAQRYRYMYLFVYKVPTLDTRLRCPKKLGLEIAMKHLVQHISIFTCQGLAWHSNSYIWQSGFESLKSEDGHGNNAHIPFFQHSASKAIPRCCTHRSDRQRVALLNSTQYSTKSGTCIPVFKDLGCQPYRHPIFN